MEMRTNFRGHTAAALAWVFAGAAPLHAQMDMQHDMHMPEGPLGIPEARIGSGTSWLPDASPMHVAHFQLGAWTLMLHGSAVDRKSTRLNSSHLVISYAVFCLKKKKIPVV